LRWAPACGRLPRPCTYPATVVPFTSSGHYVPVADPKPAGEQIDRLVRRARADVSLCIDLGEKFRDEGEHYFQGVMVGAALAYSLLEKNLSVIDNHINGKVPKEVDRGVRQDQKHDPPQQGEVQSLW
jgi:hypothetical protein